MSSVASLLTRALRVLDRHHPRPEGWRIEHEPGTLRLLLRVEGRELTVRVGPRDDAPAYASTASLSLTIATDEPLSEQTETLLQRLVAMLRHADDGALRFPRPPPRAPHPVAASPALRQRLHRASWLAWRVLQGEDLYPHIRELGGPVSQAQLLDGWRRAVALRETGTGPDELGLYLHIPFCAHICRFCYCARVAGVGATRIQRYVEQLLRDAEVFAPILQDQVFTSVYVGGGTPSILQPGTLRTMFSSLYARFQVPPGTQVIFEGNPESLTPRKVAVLAQVGRVTRLTVGVQALEATVQAQVGRHNTPAQVARAVSAARAEGIPHVNLDLVVGLPGQTLAGFQRDLDLLMELAPDSIHLNAFRPLPRVGLVRSGLITHITPEQRVLRDQMMQWGAHRLSDGGHGEALGQGPHRTRNAANLQEYDLRTQNSSLLGLGFGARSHSFGGHFYAHHALPDFDRGVPGYIAGERHLRAMPSDPAEERHKFLVRNFATGFSRSAFRELFGADALEVAPQAFEDLDAIGVLEVDGDAVTFHTRGTAQRRVLRTLLYSEATRARAWEAWGRTYDEDEDYEAKLAGVV